jgi:hypothetical protein
MATYRNKIVMIYASFSRVILVPDTGLCYINKQTLLLFNIDAGINDRPDLGARYRPQCPAPDSNHRSNALWLEIR